MPKTVYNWHMNQGPRIRPLRLLFATLLLIGVVGAFFLFCPSSTPSGQGVQKTPFMAQRDKLDAQRLNALYFITAEQANLTPLIDGFEMPNTQGASVTSVARGLVVYCRPAQAGAEGLVIVAHRSPKGELIFSRYSSLHQLQVKRGQMVARGDSLGEFSSDDAASVQLVQSLQIPITPPAESLDIADLVALYPAPACADYYPFIRRQAAQSSIQLQMTPPTPSSYEI